MKATIAIATVCVGALLPGARAHGYIDVPGNRQTQCNSLENEEGIYYLASAGSASTCEPVKVTVHELPVNRDTVHELPCYR